MTTITPIIPPEHSGDWHDKPLKWQVNGLPEVQKFCTKKDAQAWIRIRKKVSSFNEASVLWLKLYP